MKGLTSLSVTLVLLFAGSAFADYGYDTSNTYAWGDSDETWGPEYSWVDASSGSEWSYGSFVDDGYWAIITPFDISFYGNYYPEGSNFYVGSNGNMGFNSSGMTSYGNTDLPNSWTPNDQMAVYWHDLQAFSTYNCHCYSYVSGTAPDRFWVISWDPWLDLWGASNTIQFQSIIYENDGSFDNMIMLQYEDTTSDYSSSDHGLSSTAGIENSDGTEGHAYCYNEGNLYEDLAVVYVGVDGLYPNPFDLLLPADGSTIQVPDGKGTTSEAASLGGGQDHVGYKGSVDVTFEWENNGLVMMEDSWEMVEFELLIDDDPGFGSPDYDIPGITGENPSYMQTISVTEDTTFYWRVIASFIAFDGDFSTTCNDDFSFTLDVTPYVNVQPASLGVIRAMFE